MSDPSNFWNDIRSNIMTDHINAEVEARAKEIEAFILAQLRVSDINPIDVVLVEHRRPDGLVILSLEVKP